MRTIFVTQYSSALNAHVRQSNLARQRGVAFCANRRGFAQFSSRLQLSAAMITGQKLSQILFVLTNQSRRF
jgi:hypothetical protein